MKLHKLISLFLFCFVVFSCINESESPQTEKEVFQHRFGVDGLSINYVNTIAEIGDGVSGSNGIDWHMLEPEAPDGNIHNYTFPTLLAEIAQKMAAAGREVQLNFRMTSDWALERDPERMIMDPSGTEAPGILSVKPAYEESLSLLIKKLVKETDVKYLQVGSEAENEWLEPAGFVKALSIIYKAAKAVKPDIVIMTFGFNPGEYFLYHDGTVEMEAAEKLNFVKEVIQAGNNYFDVFCFHANRSYEAINPTVAWIKEQMKTYNLEKPVWIDDMYSGPWLSGKNVTQEEQHLLDQMISGNQQTIEMYDSLQAIYMVKKIGSAFAAGVKRIFVSTDVDWPHYYIPMWHFGGLLKYDGQPKPAFYTLKNMVNHLDLFSNCKEISENIIKFEKEKETYYLLWDDTNKILDLNELAVGAKFEMNELITTQQTSGEVKIIEGTLQLSAIPVLIRLMKN